MSDKIPFEDEHGQPLAHGRVVVYDVSGDTINAKPNLVARVYKNPEKTERSENPLPLDEDGKSSNNIFLDDGFYVISNQRAVEDHESVLLADQAPFAEVAHSKIIRVMNGVGGEETNVERFEREKVKQSVLLRRVDQLEKFIIASGLGLPEELPDVEDEDDN